MFGAGIAISIACVALVISQIQPRAMLASFARIDPFPVVLALLTIVTSYLIQAWRWQLLRPVDGSLPYRRALAFLMIGLSANILLPLRSGDLVRVFLVRRAFGGSGGRALASVIVERLFDILSIIAFGAVILLGGNWPQPIAVGFDIMTALAITAAAALIILVGLASRSTVAALRWFLRPLPLAAAARITGFVEQVMIGIRSVGAISRLIAIGALSLVIWGLITLAMYCFLLAFHLQLPFRAGVLVMVTTHLGAALPSAPAGIGVYQELVLLTLAVWDIAPSIAAGVAIFSHAAFVCLQLVCGAASAWVEGGSVLFRKETLKGLV